MFKSIILSILLLAGSTLLADTQQEINHLLDFVGKTSCTYERNGSMHAGPDAKEHITKKYDYYKEKIKTSEDFIRYSATKSELSGKKYQVHCPGKATQYSSDWLLTELKAYRKAHP
ncbi:MAG: DUF5329 domain-containing protein [Campylobacterota bacterium]|nr:DUF5329 domain-containing protein [Campylobacterota bacterium]